MAEQTYEGTCHCNSIGFRLTTTLDPGNWTVRACQCRFCRIHDARSTSDPSGSLLFFANESGALQRHRFALHTADFLVCKRCGVYIGAVIETSEGRFGIANTNALGTMPAGIAKVSAISYDNEDQQSRIIRRIQRWTPVSQIPWQKEKH